MSALGTLRNLVSEQLHWLPARVAEGVTLVRLAGQANPCHFRFSWHNVATTGGVPDR
jgi:hypothetical protein